MGLEKVVKIDMITGQTNSEDIFKKLNLALQRFEDKKLSCPNNEKILIPIYDCKKESIKVVTREEFLGLIRSYNCSKSDFVILGEVFKGQTKTVTEVVKEFITQFDPSSFFFISERLTFNRNFKLPDEFSDFPFVRTTVYNEIFLDFTRHFEFIWGEHYRNFEDVWINFLRNEYWKRIVNKYYVSKKDSTVENFSLDYSIYFLKISSNKLGYYEPDFANKKVLLFILEMFYIFRTRPNQPHFSETGLGEELLKNPEITSSFKRGCEKTFQSSDWKTLVQSYLQPDNTNYLYQSQKNDFIIFADEFYQFLFKEKI